MEIGEDLKLKLNFTKAFIIHETKKNEEAQRKLKHVPARIDISLKAAFDLI